MLTKVIIIVGCSVVAVVAMFFFGRYMDKGNSQEPTEKNG